MPRKPIAALTLLALLPPAIVLAQTGPLERARDTVQQAIAWNLLGSVARGIGDLPAARHAFEESLRVNPDQPRTQQVLQELETPDAP